MSSLTCQEHFRGASEGQELNEYNLGRRTGLLLMTPYKKAVITILVFGSCFGCADSRVQRSDEEAMMLYRDCMGGMPPQWEPGDTSAALDSEHVASASAGAETRRESRQHIECAQRASWEEK